MDIKHYYELMPKKLKMIIGYLGRQRIIHSRDFLDTYRALDRYDKSSKVEKQEIQKHILKDTLIYAYENCPYYRDLFDAVGFDAYSFSNLDEIRVIPYLTKAIILEQKERMYVDSVKNFYLATSGGTSGRPVTVAFDMQSLYKERAFVYHYWSKFGYDFKRSKLLSFREHNFHGQLASENPIYNELIINPFLLDAKHIDEIVEKANLYGAEFLYGYPSVIGPFCGLLKKNGIRIQKPIKAIFLISENLYPDQMKMIQEIYDCPIAMFYGHTEKAVFAEEYEGVYYFDDLYGYTEILDNAESNIVCTGFINKKMPLIRYLVDDRAERSGGGYRIIGHRENEFLIGFHDYKVSATSVEFTHESAFEKIQEYQFIQDNIGEVTMLLNAVEPLSKNEIDAVYQCVQNKLPGFHISLEMSKPIRRTTRGKYSLIIQNIRNDVGVGV